MNTFDTTQKLIHNKLTLCKIKDFIHLLIAVFSAFCCFITVYNMVSLIQSDPNWETDKLTWINALTIVFSLFVLAAFIVAIHFFCLVLSGIRIRSDFPKFKEYLVEQGRPLSVQELAQQFHTSPNRIKKRIDAVLDHGYLPDVYLNYAMNYLMFKEDLYNENVFHAAIANEPTYRVICNRCGAENTFHVHQNRICTFCGGPIR